MNAMDLSCALSMKFTFSTPNPALLCSSMPDLAFFPRFFNICAKQGVSLLWTGIGCSRGRGGRTDSNVIKIFNNKRFRLGTRGERTLENVH